MAGVPAAFPSFVPVTITITLIGWSLLGLAVLLSTTSAILAATFQYSFLTLTSILMFIVPLGAVSAHRRSTQSTTVTVIDALADLATPTSTM
jgi:hypothetical protein